MNKVIKIKKAMVAFATVLAMTLMLLPAVKAEAAVTVLAAPKYAKQTISTETAEFPGLQYRAQPLMYILIQQIIRLIQGKL